MLVTVCDSPSCGSAHQRGPLIRNGTKDLFHGLLWGHLPGRLTNGLTVSASGGRIHLVHLPPSPSLPQALSECLRLRPASLHFRKARLSLPSPPALSWPPSCLCVSICPSLHPLFSPLLHLSDHSQKEGSLGKTAGRDPWENLIRSKRQTGTPAVRQALS